MVEPATRYRFRGWVRCENVTTDQGVGFRIEDAESGARLHLEFGNLLGTAGWQPVEQAFVTPAQTRLLRVQVVRRPSWKFDSKIGGTVWLDDLELTPAADRR